MKISISGILLNVSFPELTTYKDGTRVVQCVLKVENTKQIFHQEVAVCLTANFKKTDYEKIALRKVINKYFPYYSEILHSKQSSTKLSRREIWHDYLVSSTKRRRLISPKLVEEITSKYTTPQTH